MNLTINIYAKVWCNHALIENNYDLVHGLLEVEGAPRGLEKYCGQFDNDWGTLFLCPEPRMEKSKVRVVLWWLWCDYMIDAKFLGDLNGI